MQLQPLHGSGGIVRSTTTIDNGSSAMDPIYRVLRISTHIDNQKIEETMEKCITFSKKYGQIKWCDEIGNLVDVYMKTMELRIPRPMYR